jgi:hypothetical protein
MKTIRLETLTGVIFFIDNAGDCYNVSDYGGRLLTKFTNLQMAIEFCLMGGK